MGCSQLKDLKHQLYVRPYIHVRGMVYSHVIKRDTFMKLEHDLDWQLYSVIPPTVEEAALDEA